MSHTKILDRLSKAETVVVDVETSGLDWKRNYVVGYVLSFSADPGDSYYVPVRHRGNRLAPKEDQAPFVTPHHEFEMDLNSIFKSKKIHLIGHNIAFDLKFMSRHGIDLSNCTFEDTMINAALIDENRGSYSLENCCITAGVQPKLGNELYKYLADKFGGAPAQKQMGNFWKLDKDDPMAHEYAKGDGISTWQLWEQQQKDLDDEDLRRVWAVENRCIRTLHRMMMRGVLVDQDRLKYVSGEVNKLLDEAMSHLPDGINLRSGPQMKKLFDDAGITSYPQTEKGNPSFAENWLLTTDLGKKVVAARKYGNLINSFINPMETHMFAGRIYTEFNQSRSDQFGTVTGRLSSSRPNMQQVPKRNVELGKLLCHRRGPA